MRSMPFVPIHRASQHPGSISTPTSRVTLFFCALAMISQLACHRGAPAPVTAVQDAVTIGTWAPNVSYSVGNLATYNGITYRCIQAHTSQTGWQPPNVPALWNRPGPAGIVPWTTQTAYALGSGVTYNGLIYRCITAHTSQSTWTPPATPNLWKLTADVQIPAGVSGSVSFVFKTKNVPTNVIDSFGLVQRDAFGDATYTELLDSSKRAVGETFHRIRVQGGEIFEFYLQANKTNVTSSPAMSAATYSSDPTMNSSVDPTYPDHVAQPLQTSSQKTANIWSLKWESYKFGDAGRDGNFDDFTVELHVDPPCNNTTIVCTDPNLVVSTHSSSVADYRGDVSTPIAGPVPGVSTGPLHDPAGGEGNPMPIGTTVDVGGRVDTLRWSFVHDATDFSAATPATTASCSQCSPPGAAQLGGNLWSLQIRRIHRPRAEAWVSSFGPGVFSNFDAKLTIAPNGVGNQNTVVFFDPSSDAPPVTFYELSQQDGDSSVDGHYHDNATRMYASLDLLNSSGAAEPNPFNATTAVVTRQTGEKYKFEVINVQGSGATQLQGRLISVLDRNANSTTVTYQFAASSTDTQLGGDRKKLWLVNRVADPHNVGATMTYQLRTGTSRWVVQSISLPDVTSVQYGYGTDTANLDRLTSVTYANGDVSTFARAWDAPSQSWALTFKDADSGNARIWKTVYVTGTTYTTTDNVVHNQEPNLVRRIVNNNTEQVYQAMEDPNDPSTTYFREATRITRLKVDATGLPRETARATAQASDPLTAPYSVIESYVGDTLGMIQQATDAFSNTRTFIRDSKTRAVSTVIARGGSKAVYTLNGFLQPTQTLDRLNRTTTAGYDSKGNPQTITHAVGTSVQAAWTYVYNSKGQVTKVTDPNTKATDYGYNSAGFLSSITEPPDVIGGTRAVRTFEYYPSGRLSASVDASSRRVTFTYDGRGRLQTTSYPDASTETVAYGSGATAGLPTSKTDRNGIVEKYEYDASRRLTKQTSAFGKPEQIATTYEYAPGTEQPSAQTTAGERVELIYDERLRLTSRKQWLNGTDSLTSQMSWDTLNRDVLDTDPYGRRAFHVYDANDRLTRTVTELVPGGVPTGSDPKTLARNTGGNPPYIIDETSYDNMNQVASTMDARGVVSTSSYDGQGRRITAIQAGSRQTTYEYDLAGNLTKQNDPRTFTEGQTFQTVFAYTGRNLLKSKTEAFGSADAATASYTYTPTGKVATMTDPRGGVTTYGYDTCCDRMTSMTDPAGFASASAYDNLGNRTSSTNALGKTTTYTFDGLNRMTKETNPLGQATTYTYDDNLADGVGLDSSYGDFIDSVGFGANADGAAVLITNAAGEKNLLARDGAGRTVLTVNASGNGTFTDYDAVVNGLVETAVTDPLDHTNRQRVDGAGRVRTSVDALSKATNRTFDPAGNLLSERDPNNVGHDCTYDNLGQRTSCTDTQGDPSTWIYDAAGNVVSTNIGNQVPTTCTFDFRNRKKRCTDGVGAQTTWVYDGNSNVTSITDGETRVTSYTYDGRNLRLTETYPDSSGPTDHVTRTYDGAARLATKTDQASNTIMYTYDDADRLTKKTDPDGKSDTLMLDSVGRLLNGVSDRYGTTVIRTYDTGGRLATEGITELTTESGYTVTYGYDVIDRLQTLTYPDGSQVTRSYTSRNQIDTITRGMQSLAQYVYDDGGRISTTTLGNGLVETRGYRPDNIVSSMSTPHVGDFSYTYDSKKQKLTEGGSATNGPQAFTYDGQGRVTNWTSGDSSQSWTLSPVGDWQTTTRSGTIETRTHDFAHEVTAVNGTSITYDPRGNVTADDTGHRLTWDFDNNLTSSIVNETGAGPSYLYDVLGRKVGRLSSGTTTLFVHAGEEVVAEYDNGALRIDYILGAEIDRPIAYVTAGSLYWFSANHLGTIAAITDGSGAVVERYQYSAYGGRTVLSPNGSVRTSSATGNQVGFTGRYHDDLSSLIDFRSRQFSPHLGRFLARDSSYVDGMSLYGAYFVPNGIDPSGHAAFGFIGNLFGFGGLVATEDPQPLPPCIGFFCPIPPPPGTPPPPPPPPSPPGNGNGGNTGMERGSNKPPPSVLNKWLNPKGIQINALADDLKRILDACASIAKCGKRGAYILGQLKAASIPIFVNLMPSLYSWAKEQRDPWNHNKIVNVNVDIGVLGLAQGPNKYPDGSIARLDTLLVHEFAHAYGFLFPNGVGMTQDFAMGVENEYRACKGYEQSSAAARDDDSPPI